MDPAFLACFNRLSAQLIIRRIQIISHIIVLSYWMPLIVLCRVSTFLLSNIIRFLTHVLVSWLFLWLTYVEAICYYSHFNAKCSNKRISSPYFHKHSWRSIFLVSSANIIKLLIMASSSYMDKYHLHLALFPFPTLQTQTILLQHIIHIMPSIRGSTKLSLSNFKFFNSCLPFSPDILIHSPIHFLKSPVFKVLHQFPQHLITINTEDIASFCNEHVLMGSPFIHALNILIQYFISISSHNFIFEPST